MESYIMVHDESRSDNGCPNYIKYIDPRWSFGCTNL